MSVIISSLPPIEFQWKEEFWCHPVNSCHRRGNWRLPERQGHFWWCSFREGKGREENLEGSEGIFWVRTPGSPIQHFCFVTKECVPISSWHETTSPSWWVPKTSKVNPCLHLQGQRALTLLTSLTSSPATCLPTHLVPRTCWTQCCPRVFALVSSSVSQAISAVTSLVPSHCVSSVVLLGEASSDHLTKSSVFTFWSYSITSPWLVFLYLMVSNDLVVVYTPYKNIKLQESRDMSLRFTPIFLASCT